MSSFSFDEDAFKKVAEAAVKERMRKMQSVMDRLGKELKGQSVETAKERLGREWQRDGDTLTDPELTEYATHLTEGTQIVFQYGGMT